ncbi:MAG: DVU0524 family FlgM-associated protein [Desulfovibrio sp.]
MSRPPAKVNTVLKNYGRQLTSAKRLARFRKAMKLGMPDEVHSAQRVAKRQALIQRIAREIVENLIVNGSENPVIADIKNRLEETLGEMILFDYPVEGGEVQLLRMTENGPELLDGEERSGILKLLWEITLEKVDETTL